MPRRHHSPIGLLPRLHQLRLRPLVLALCGAGIASAALAQISATPIPALTLPDVVRQVGPISAPVVTSTQTTANMAFTQTGRRAAVEFNSFNVGRQASVTNTAERPSDVTLYRVVGGGSPSLIYGQVNANNQLFVINQGGIYVGAGGSVSGASVVLSARDLDPRLTADGYAAFLAGGNVVFNTTNADGLSMVQLAPAGLDEQGVPHDAAVLRAGPGGAVILVGNQGVRNQGLIQAGSGGQAALVAAGSTELNVGDSGFVTLKSYDGATDNSIRAVLNEGQIDAPNGQVTLAAVGSGSVSNSGNVILNSLNDSEASFLTLRALMGQGTTGSFNTGQIRAQGSGGGQGRIDLLASGQGSVVATLGSLDASALDAASRAGVVHLSAATVQVGLNASLTAILRADGPAGGGRILIDDAMALSDAPTSWLYIGQGSLLSASATGQGDGGQITVSTAFDCACSGDAAPFSDYGVAEVYGTLQARGAGTGKGGQIETSASVVNTRYTEFDGDGQVADNRGVIDVAGGTGGSAGSWTVYSPSIEVRTDTFSSGFGDYIPPAQVSLVQASDINTVLNGGGTVTLSTHRSTDPIDLYGGITLTTGTFIERSTGTRQATLTLSSDRDVLLEAGSAIVSQAGPLKVNLLADVDQDGSGSVLTQGQDGSSSVTRVSSNLRSVQAVVANTGLVQIATQGADLVLSGQGDSHAGVDLQFTQIDTSASSGPAGAITLNGEGRFGQHGVSVQNSGLQGHDISVTGRSSAGTGVLMTDTTVVSDSGAVAVRGVATRDPQASTGSSPFGVDLRNVQFQIGQGSALLAGRGEGAGAMGVRYSDLRFLTSAGGQARITLAGQSLLSTAPGLGVAPQGQALVVADESGSQPSDAHIVIGASADATAVQALNLGGSGQAPQFDANGWLNLRPLGVDAQGQVTELFDQAIAVGQSPISGTNFLVDPTWFNSAFNNAIEGTLSTVIGSSLHRGQITAENGALDGAHAVTLQNQGAASQGIVLGGHNDAGPTQTLTLMTTGRISQQRALWAQTVRIVGGPQTDVSLPLDNEVDALAFAGPNSIDFNSINGLSLIPPDAQWGHDVATQAFTNQVFGLNQAVQRVRVKSDTLSLQSSLLASDQGAAIDLVSEGRFVADAGVSIGTGPGGQWRVWTPVASDSEEFSPGNLYAQTTSPAGPNLYGCVFGAVSACDADVQAALGGGNHFVLAERPVLQASGGTLSVDQGDVVTLPAPVVSSNLSRWDATADYLSGSTTTTANANSAPGSYGITQGTLSGALGARLAYTPGAVTVLPAATTGGDTPTQIPTDQPVIPRRPAETPTREFELPDALQEQRTDVYVRGQIGQPQVCTAANTGANGPGQGADGEPDPLALEWFKVRRSAQLTSCSGVRSETQCAAF